MDANQSSAASCTKNSGVREEFSHITCIPKLFRSWQELLENNGELSKDRPFLLLELELTSDIPPISRNQRSQDRPIGAITSSDLPAVSRKMVESLTAEFRRFLQSRSEGGTAEEIKRRMSTLSLKEWDVLALLLEGKSNKEVAGRMKVGVATTAKHRAHIFQKLGVRNLIELMCDLLLLLQDDNNIPTDQGVR